MDNYFAENNVYLNASLQTKFMRLEEPWHGCVKQPSDVKYYYYEGAYVTDVGFNRNNLHKTAV